MRSDLAVMAETGVEHSERVMKSGAVVVGLEPALGDEDARGGIRSSEISVEADEILIPIVLEHLGEERRGAVARTRGEKRFHHGADHFGVPPVRGAQPLVEIEDVFRPGPLAEGGEASESRHPLEPGELGGIERVRPSKGRKESRESRVIAHLLVGPSEQTTVLEVARRDLLEAMERGEGVLVTAAGDLEFGLGEKHRELCLGGRFVGLPQIAVTALVAAEQLRGTRGHEVVDEGGLGVTGGAGKTAFGPGVASLGEFDESAHELHACEAATTFAPDIDEPTAAAEQAREERPEEKKKGAGGKPEENGHRESGLDERVADAHGDVTVGVHPEEEREDDRGGKKDEKSKKGLHVRASALSAATSARRSGARDGGRGGGGSAITRPSAAVARATSGLRVS